MTDYINQLEEANKKLEDTIKYLEKRTIVWRNPADIDETEYTNITNEFIRKLLDKYIDGPTIKDIEHGEIRGTNIVQILCINKKIISSIINFKGYYMSADLNGAKFNLNRLSDIKKAVEDVITLNETSIVADEPSRPVNKVAQSITGIANGTAFTTGSLIYNGTLNTGYYSTQANSSWSLSTRQPLSTRYTPPDVVISQINHSKLGLGNPI